MNILVLPKWSWLIFQFHLNGWGYCFLYSNDIYLLTLKTCWAVEPLCRKLGGWWNSTKNILSCLILDRKKMWFQAFIYFKRFCSHCFLSIYIPLVSRTWHRILAKAFHLRRFGVFQFSPALRRRSCWPGGAVLPVGAVVALAVLGVRIGNEAHHVDWLQGEKP